MIGAGEMAGGPLTDTTARTGDDWLSDSWCFAATSRSLGAGTQTRLMIMGQPVMLARTPVQDGKGGEAFALRDVCPHRFVPLSAGRQVVTNGEPTIECAYHGWRFGTDGGCRLIPALVDPGEDDVTRIHVRRFPVQETSGAIFIHVGAAKGNEEPDHPPPQFDLPGDAPRVAVSAFAALSIDDLAARLLDPTLTAPVLDPLQRDHLAGAAEFHLPGLRIDATRTASAHIVTLTCLTPMDAAQTRVDRLTYWTGAPQLDIAQALVASAERRRLAAISGAGPARPAASKPEDTAGHIAWYQAAKAAARADGPREARTIIAAARASNPSSPAT